MATKKEIELILQARLESGNDVLSKADSLGKDIAERLDQAFANIGEKIANQLVQAIQAAFQNMNVNLGGGGGQSPVGLNTANWGTSASQQAADAARSNILLRQRGDGGDQASLFDSPEARAPMVTSPRVRTQPESNSYHGSHKEMAKLYKRLGLGSDVAASAILNFDGGDDDELAPLQGAYMDKALNLDSLTRQVRSHNRFKGVNKKKYQSRENFGNYSDDQLTSSADQYENMALASDNKVIELNKEIAELKNAILKNSEVIDKATKSGDEKTAKEAKEAFDKDKEKLDRKLFTRDTLEGSSRGFLDNADTLRGARNPAWFRNAETMTMVGGGLQTAAQLSHAAAGWNLQGMRGAAGTAQVDTFSARDAMNGDVRNLLATQLAGGEDAMKSQARYDTMMNIGGNALGGLAGLAGTIATKGIGKPIFGAFGLNKGLEAVRQYREFDSEVAANMRQQQGLSFSANEPLINMSAKSRSRVQQSQNAARMMGDDSYYNYMADESSQYTEAAAAAGISSEEAFVDRRSLLQGMGGSYRGSDGRYSNLMNDPKLKELQLRSIGLKGLGGFSNMSDVQSRVFQGLGVGKDRQSEMSEAMSRSNQLFVDVKSKNFEAGAGVWMADRFANQASRGMGYTDIAELDARRMMFNMPDGASMNQIRHGANVQDRMKNEVSNTNIGNVAKNQEISALERRLGVKLTDNQRIDLRLNEWGGGSGLKRYLDQQGIKAKEGVDVESLGDQAVLNIDKRVEQLNSNVTGSGSLLDRRLGDGTLDSLSEVRRGRAAGTGILPKGSGIGAKDPALETMTTAANAGRAANTQDAQNEAIVLKNGMKVLGETAIELAVAFGRAKEQMTKSVQDGYGHATKLRNEYVTNSEYSKEVQSGRIGPDGRVNQGYSAWESLQHQFTGNDIYRQRPATPYSDAYRDHAPSNVAKPQTDGNVE